MFEPLPPSNIWDDRSHWRDTSGKSFKNPWPSFNPDAVGFWKALKLLLIHPKKVPVPENIHEIFKVVAPQWSSFSSDELRATWLGHATFVVELPSQHRGGRGIRILFDPVFSRYTSPAVAAKLGLGPKRYSKLPCTVDDLPEIDIVCISHNHYDHLDLDTVRLLEARTTGTMQYICGLNNRRHFEEFGVDAKRVHEMDWSQNCKVTVESLDSSFTMSCCPAQHTSARSIWDTDESLWCSWLIETPEIDSITKSRKVYFAGDTGYGWTATDDRTTMMRCPVFRELGSHFGPIDLSLLPIGLFLPRHFLSNVHCAPEDAVDLHRDIKSRKSVAMHYGTFRGGLSRNFEEVLDPPRRLRAYLDRENISRDEFVTLDLGGHVNV